MSRSQFQPELSLAEFLRDYGDEARCEAAVVKARSPNGFVCERCQCTRFGPTHNGRRLWQCKDYGHQSASIVGTRGLITTNISTVRASSNSCIAVLPSLASLCHRIARRRRRSSAIGTRFFGKPRHSRWSVQWPLGEAIPVKYAFIQQPKNEANNIHRLSTFCRVLAVSRSGFL